MKVAADMVCQKEITKACHQGMGSLQESVVLAGHFGRDDIGALVVARWYFPHIFKLDTEIIKYCDTCQSLNTTKL